MKPEFEIEQIRDFVNKGYTSVSARYVKAALQHYDELVKNCIKPDVSQQRELLLDFMTYVSPEAYATHSKAELADNYLSSNSG